MDLAALCPRRCAPRLMNESAYRAARGKINRSPCVFEKAQFAGAARCALARRHMLAERETVSCTVPAAHSNCSTFAELLRERSTFVLRLPPPGTRLPHAAGMKLQCGGLAGLAGALGATDTDAHQLLAAALARWGSLLDLPWRDLVHAVAGWRIRRRHRGSEGA